MGRMGEGRGLGMENIGRVRIRLVWCLVSFIRSCGRMERF